MEQVPQKKDWATVVWLVLFFPVGLFKMWRSNQFPILVKVTITLLFVGIPFVAHRQEMEARSVAQTISLPEQTSQTSEEVFEPFHARMTAFTPGQVAWVEGLGKRVGKNGTPVIVIAQNETQYKIRMESGDEGWIDQDNIVSRMPVADLSGVSQLDKDKVASIYKEVLQLLNTGKEMMAYHNKDEKCGQMMRINQEKARKLRARSESLPSQYHSLITATMRLEQCVSCSRTLAKQQCWFVERDLMSVQDSELIKR